MTKERDACGNCKHFNPGQGEKFFNCTQAQHAGLKYGMQVREDSRGCEGHTPK